MKKKAVEKIINRSGYERRSSRRFVIFTAFIFAMVATLSFLMTSNMKKTVATDFSGFKAGNIISDAVMRNYISMTESEIQTFLDKHVSCDRAASGGQYVNAGTAYGVKYNYKATYGDTTYFYHVENGKYVCMNSEKFNDETAAHIIYSLAHQYHINPQVLLVLLEKEQGLVSDNWPNSNFQYRSAAGFGCPDTAPCDSKYYGLRNQVESAAWLFDQVLSGGWTNYDVGNNWIRFSPNASCGGSWVNIENKATAALYRYTPYQPNAAAIKNYPGGATCGAYGNRNFYAFFTDWFGSTQKVQYTFVQNYYNKNKNTTGSIVGDTVCTDQAGETADFTKDGDYSCYQDFDKGTLFWNTNIKDSVRTESNEVFFDKAKAEAYKKLTPEQKKDPIYSKWLEQYDELGDLENVVVFEKDNKYNVAKAKNGIIIGNATDGFYTYDENIYNIFVEHFDELGMPVSGWANNSRTKMEWYEFKTGYILGNDSNGWYVSTGKIRSIWAAQGYEGGSLGFPKSNIEYKKEADTYYQIYSGGVVYGNETNDYYSVSKNIFDKWDKFSNQLGAPAARLNKNPRTGMEWYEFKTGYIVGNNSNGWYVSFGKTRDSWAAQGYEGGYLGFPKSDVIFDEETNIYYQTYAGGTVFGNDELGYSSMKNKVFEKYNKYSDKLGVVMSGLSRNSKTGMEWYEFKNGYIVGNDKKGWFLSIGKSRDTWAWQRYETGPLGFQKSDFERNDSTGMEWQVYEGGYIVGNDEKGWFESRGKIRTKWAASGYEFGKYGFPTSHIINGCQDYEHGRICQ